MTSAILGISMLYVRHSAALLSGLCSCQAHAQLTSRQTRLQNKSWCPLGLSPCLNSELSSWSQAEASCRHSSPPPPWGSHQPWAAVQTQLCCCNNLIVRP